MSPVPPDMIDANSGRLQQVHVCVIVDTEEEFDWRSSFSRSHNSVRAISALPVGHDLFQRYGLKPTYLIDYPVTQNKVAQELLASWSSQGSCVIGAQLHPWVNPPHEEVVCLANSYPRNLPADLERRKLTLLLDAIQAISSAPVRVYKAGRYGLDIRREAQLAELGIEVDTSVTPYRSFAGSGGGSDFFDYPVQPFYTRDVGRLLFLPVTQSLTGPLRHLPRRIHRKLFFSRTSERLRVPGALARTGLLERIMLTPEGIPADAMIRLADSMVRDGCRVLCFSLHSPSFMPGCTPYVRDDADLGRFIDTIDRTLNHLFSKLGAVPTTPLALRTLLPRPRA